MSRVAIAIVLVCLSRFASAQVPLSRGEVAVLEVLQGKSKVLNDAAILQAPGYIGNGDRYTLNQIINESEALIRIGATSYIAKGLKTDGLIDGTEYGFERKLIALLGTEAYTTVTGAKRTVGVAYIVDFSDVKAGVAHINRAVRTREWPKVGRATFVEMKDGKVILQDSTGRQTQIDVAELPNEDRDWIRKQTAAEVEQAKKFKTLAGFGK